MSVSKNSARADRAVTIFCQFRLHASNQVRHIKSHFSRRREVLPQLSEYAHTQIH